MSTGRRRCWLDPTGPLAFGLTTVLGAAAVCLAIRMPGPTRDELVGFGLYAPGPAAPS